METANNADASLAIVILLTTQGRSGPPRLSREDRDWLVRTRRSNRAATLTTKHPSRKGSYSIGTAMDGSATRATNTSKATRLIDPWKPSRSIVPIKSLHCKGVKTVTVWLPTRREKVHYINHGRRPGAEVSTLS